MRNLLYRHANETVSPYHDRMPFMVRVEQFEEWLGTQWETVLANPNKSPLDKMIKQPELF